MSEFEHFESDEFRLSWRDKIQFKVNDWIAREPRPFKPRHMVATACGLMLFASGVVAIFPPQEESLHQRSETAFLNFLDCLEVRLAPDDSDQVLWTLLDPSIVVPPASQRVLEDCRQVYPLPQTK